MKQKVNCDELPVEITLLGLPHMVKAASETWPNPCVSSFQREPSWEMDLMPKVDFTLSVMPRIIILESKISLEKNFYLIPLNVFDLIS